MSLPAFLKPLFWDVAFEKLDAERDRDLIVARVAEYGTDQAVRWVRETYDRTVLAQALENRRHLLSAGTLNLWRLWLQKPDEWCARIPSRPLKGSFWRS